jgi:lipopolysaccharide transport system permease protein
LLQDVWSHRHLVMTLIRRQYQIRYRQSFVGVVWAIIPPLASLGAGTLVFDQIFGVDTGKTSYALFTLSALVPWSFLSSGLSSAVTSVTAGQSLVTRSVFPRAVLPIGAIGTAFIDFAIAGVLFVVLLFAIGDGLRLTAAWFPALLLIEVVLVTGLALLGSALHVFARDVKLAVPLVIQFWLFLTPVMYPMSEIPVGLRPWYLANPMTGVVESFRRILLFGQTPDLGMLAPAIIGAVVVLIVGSWYFRATESRFADVI